MRLIPLLYGGRPRIGRLSESRPAKNSLRNVGGLVRRRRRMRVPCDALERPRLAEAVHFEPVPKPAPAGIFNLRRTSTFAMSCMSRLSRPRQLDEGRTCFERPYARKLNTRVIAAKTMKPAPIASGKVESLAESRIPAPTKTKPMKPKNAGPISFDLPAVC